MKLNIECVRDVFLYVEGVDNVEKQEDYYCLCPIFLDAVFKGLPQYRQEDVFYTVAKLAEAGLIDVVGDTNGVQHPEIAVVYLTYEGHELLNKIRDAARWKLIKKCAASVRNYSLDAIGKIAEGLGTAAINKWLAGNPDA